MNFTRVGIDCYAMKVPSGCGRILKGEKPGRRQKPSWINLKTAKALGLEVLPTLPTIADKTIK